jgi:hypothetical protein
MKIIIETIPHASQPYPTCGDWRTDSDGVLRINVSEEIGDKYAFLVALHELVEVRLCQLRKISTEEVDKFDKAYEATRPDGDNSEPGDSPDAPYRDEHFFATSIERLMALEMGVNWAEYEAAINKLP